MKQPLLVFMKPLHELPPSVSQSLVNVESSSSQRELLMMQSAHCSPDRTSSCCWLTPHFEVGSASCSTTPCSSTRGAGDDVVGATSPCSSTSSSSSSSSHTLPRQADITSADVPPVCTEPCETVSDTSVCETAPRLSDELVPSVHSAAECTCPLATSRNTEPLHAHSASEELSDR